MNRYLMINDNINLGVIVNADTSLAAKRKLLRNYKTLGLEWKGIKPPTIKTFPKNFSGLLALKITEEGKFELDGFVFNAEINLENAKEI